MSSSVVTKVLLDFDVFQQLLSYKEEVLKLHELKKKDLEIVSQPEQGNSSGTLKPKLSLENSIADQKGSGVDYETRISQLVVKQLAEQYNLDALQKLLPGNFYHKIILTFFLVTLLQSFSDKPIAKQVGGGCLDLLPPILDFIDLHVEQPTEFVAQEQKSSQFDQFDEEKLLTEVPPKFRKNAQQLLGKIREDPLSIDFNSNGELFIDSVSIPDANISTFFLNCLCEKKNTCARTK